MCIKRHKYTQTRRVMPVRATAFCMQTATTGKNAFTEAVNYFKTRLFYKKQFF